MFTPESLFFLFGLSLPALSLFLLLLGLLTDLDTLGNRIPIPNAHLQNQREVGRVGHNVGHPFKRGLHLVVLLLGYLPGAAVDEHQLLDPRPA